MRMISKIFLVFGILFLILSMQFLFAEPVEWENEKAYYPYPVIFIHGTNSKPEAWQSSINQLFNNYLNKYCPKVYIDGERKEDPNYPPAPAKRYLEVFNYRDNSFASIETHNDEMAAKVRKILETYYGSNWQSNPKAKVIIVAHSQGGLIARAYLRKYPQDAQYVDRLVAIGVPHRGSYLSDIAQAATAGKFVLTAWGFINPVWWAVEAGVFLKVYFSEARPFLFNLRSPALKEMQPGSEFLEGSNGLNKTVPPVPTICIVSDLGGTMRPGDGVVSFDSQRGILNGQSAFTPEAVIEIMPGVKHEEETSQPEPIFKSLDGMAGIETDIPIVQISTATINPYLTTPVIWGEYTDHLPAYDGVKVIFA